MPKDNILLKTRTKGDARNLGTNHRKDGLFCRPLSWSNQTFTFISIQ